MTNRVAATNKSVECVPATIWNSGRSNSRPTRMRHVTATAALKSALDSCVKTEAPLPAPSTETKTRIGMTARSCASSTEKLARPAVVVRRPAPDSSSSTMAVDDSARLAPRITAAAEL